MRIVLILFAPLMRIIDSIADGDFYLHAIAVDKELRGDGVGSVLMDSFEGLARADRLDYPSTFQLRMRGLADSTSAAG